jgi:hypothetical protein
LKKSQKSRSGHGKRKTKNNEGGGVMLDKILRELGWYRHPDSRRVADKKFGKFTIEGGKIAPSDFLGEKDYYRIIGSKHNDGLYQYPNSDLTDEVFDGAVWVMRIPPAVVTLAQDIKKYTESDAGKPSAYISESFGGYSYTKATNSKGVPQSWKQVFADELDALRMI